MTALQDSNTVADAATFWSAFWPALAAGLVVGLVLLGVGYALVEKRLRLRERAKRERATVRTVLQIVYDELLHNAAHVTLFREELPKMQVPSPGFELGGWSLASQTQALLAIGHDTADKLVHTYNRMRGANEIREQLLDLVNGRSILQVELAAAVSALPDGSANPRVSKTMAEVEQHKESVRDGLLRRLDDLEPYLNAAIDKVEQAIEIEAPTKAADRRFIHAKEVDRIQ